MRKNTESFPAHLVETSEFAKLLAHPARLSILETLAEKKECVCGELVGVLPLAQSTVSQHLLELKKMELIQGEIEGTKSCYCINWETWEKMQGDLNLFLKSIQKLKPKSNKNCC